MEHSKPRVDYWLGGCHCNFVLFRRAEVDNFSPSLLFSGLTFPLAFQASQWESGLCGGGSEESAAHALSALLTVGSPFVTRLSFIFSTQRFLPHSRQTESYFVPPVKHLCCCALRTSFHRVFVVSTFTTLWACVCVCACGERLLNAVSSIRCWPGLLFPRQAGRDNGSGNGNAACIPSSWQA